MATHSMAQKVPADEGYKQQFEVITSQTRITSLLRPLLNRHSLITVSVPGGKRYYNSVLLEVDADNQYLMLDELHPKEGHKQLSGSEVITLFTQLDGVNVNFAVTIKEITSSDGVAMYKVAFPQSIRYRQRRSDYRVPVSSALSIPVQLVSGDKLSFSGELHDISAGGACIRFPRKTSLPLDKDDAELQCEITLGNGKKIFCAFRICHIALQEINNTLHVGGCFQRLDRIQHRAIERFVVELQRKSRQNLTR
jgi:c-di-GMP-binding flagellar brake protein YcgR